MKTNTSLKPMFKKPKYLWKDTDTETISLQRQPERSGSQGGHYDTITAGNPRLHKYFGGSFLKAI